MLPQPEQRRDADTVAGRLRSRIRVGVAALVALLLATAVIALQPGELDNRLREADALKSSNYARFAAMLGEMDAADQPLSPAQRQYLNYLKAWERGYAGDYEAAIPLYKSVIAESDDSVLQFRATASLVSNLTIARRYLEAYTYLDLLVERMPQTTDLLAREQGLHAAALLNNQAGQYELGLDFSTRLLHERMGLRGECIARELRVESLYKSKRLEPDGEDVSFAIEACQRHGEAVFASIVRSFQAHAFIDKARYREARDVLESNYEEVQKTRYLRIISEFDVLLAESYWQLGDLPRARNYALRAIDKRLPKEVTDSLVAAYRLLYRISLQQNDTKSALAYHEKYAEADKQNFDDISARSLAYQMARHQATATKLQIEALNKQNQVLQLEQQLGAKAVETSRLYIALLIAVLLMLVLWAFYTKRRQLYFRRLSQRDGLTQIANRPHFLEASARALDECRRAGGEAAVILFDLDHFKVINDRHGHAAGDHVLRKVTAACRTYLRPEQYFGRIGGEEFAILLIGYDEARAVALAEQLRRAVTAANADGAFGEFSVSASFGVTSTRKAGHELRQLLACADAALYQAKLDGRDRVATFDGSPATVAATPLHAQRDRLLGSVTPLS
ncbi:diguanylate cyclase [Tahibacter aquaticus]|uniref:diguanylate cyclase n=1 Tax=Tahibacter aquaticus TaxID=520092 RepID=A0A4R6Z783_9GAMM|nr:diguanylate cyclase [Tahibacter aquaticus]